MRLPLNKSLHCTYSVKLTALLCHGTPLWQHILLPLSHCQWVTPPPQSPPSPTPSNNCLSDSLGGSKVGAAKSTWIITSLPLPVNDDVVLLQWHESSTLAPSQCRTPQDMKRFVLWFGTTRLADCLCTYSNNDLESGVRPETSVCNSQLEDGKRDVATCRWQVEAPSITRRTSGFLWRSLPHFDVKYVAARRSALPRPCGHPRLPCFFLAYVWETIVSDVCCPMWVFFMCH